MHGTTYTFRELIQARIAAERRYPHEDFVNYYKRRYEVLQELFGIHFRRDEIQRELLDTLFTMLYGQPSTVFTSADLLQAGFDDSAEPRIEDYWDYV